MHWFIHAIFSSNLSCRHQMETFSALLAICAGNSPVIGEFRSQRPVPRSFNVFFDLRLNQWLSKQSWGWWFEKPSSHYDVTVMASDYFVDKCVFEWWEDLSKQNKMRTIFWETIGKCYRIDFRKALQQSTIVVPRLGERSDHWYSSSYIAGKQGECEWMD